MPLKSLRYDIPDDLAIAGEASSSVKKVLGQLGVAPEIIKRAAVSMYEAEINVVIHAGGGWAEIDIDADQIVMRLCDAGPGIPDVGLAMTAGWSTASDEIREMGFGAGLGLPNMKRYSDSMTIHTTVGKGTVVELTVKFA